MMYFTGSGVLIPDVGLPMLEEKVVLLYIEAQKKYVEYTDVNNIKIKGYSNRRRPEDIITLMKQKIRERKLDSLGI